MMDYKRGEPILFERKSFLFSHYSNKDGWCLIHKETETPEELSKLRRHPNSFSEQGRKIYLRVPLKRIQKGVGSNRQMKHLLSRGSDF